MNAASVATAFRSYLEIRRTFQAYFSQPQTIEQGRELVRRRNEQREELFLTMARTRFCAPDSPYRPLLALAQCDYRDLEIMVRQRGLEFALGRLQRAGVCLSYEEFTTGDVRREGRAFRWPVPGSSGRPTPSALSVRSGGTRSRGRWIYLPIEHVAEQTVPQYGIMLASLAGGDVPSVLWLLGFPSGAGVGTWFALAKIRRPPVRWFSLTPIPRGLIGRQGHHHLMIRTAHRAARRAGIPVPMPEFTPVRETGKVLDAVQETTRVAGGCCVFTTPNCAVRLGAEARQREASLDGVVFITGGEPLTAAKAEEIRRVGARVYCYYALSEVGSFAAAPCAVPREVDDMHFRSDALGLVTVARQFGDVTVDTLMFTSLLPTAPRPLLNVQVDDFASVVERRCGCPWDDLGCRPHLVGVRSFTKLTGEGTTLLGTNCVHIIEHLLPRAFGGASTDYQLVEAEDEEGLTRLFLLVSPRLGPLDEDTVIRRFREALARTKSPGPGGGVRQVWDQAGSIRVLRREPIPTALGKLLPFHTLGGALLSRPTGATPRAPRASDAEGSIHTRSSHRCYTKSRGP